MFRLEETYISNKALYRSQFFAQTRRIGSDQSDWNHQLHSRTLHFRKLLDRDSLLKREKMLDRNSLRNGKDCTPSLATGGHDCQHPKVFGWEAGIVVVCFGRKEEVRSLSVFSFDMIAEILVFL